MSELPVREMVLYKHGVGFFVREGETDAEEIALTFRKDEINDVLKSLAVFDRAGGHILGIHYQTPMDRDSRFATSSILLSQEGSLRDLLRDLRGRQAEMTFKVGNSELITVKGRIIGIDDPHEFNNAINLGEQTVAILGNDGQVRVFKLDQLQVFTIHDAQSQQDLTYFLDSSMREDDRRTVNIRLSDGEKHDLFVSYVAPSPTWRVSYRIVAESDDSGETGKALLQGWGLFDNRLEEDLNNVSVTLVAGQPISFIYDLYASKIPKRPTIQDEARVAPGPVEFAGAQLDAMAAMPDFLMENVQEERARGITMRSRAESAASERPTKMSRRPPPSPAQLSDATPAQAEGQDAGEFFQYVVTTPVSVKRGESALVPIINNEVNYTRELLYNRRKLPNHPVVSLRFDNQTGLTLERGPVTVVEDNTYKGEAVVPFTKDNNQVYLAYAVELGVKITEHQNTFSQTRGLEIQNKLLVYQDHFIIQLDYILQNTTDNDLTITLEATKQHDFELFDTRTPDVETTDEYRWKINVPKKSQAKFTQLTRRMQRHSQQLRKLKYADLDRFMQNRWLDQTTLDRLSEMLDYLSAMDGAKDREIELVREQESIYRKQEQIRENMQALQTTGPEADFRNKLLGQLEESQNRLEEIDQISDDLSKQIAQADAQIDSIINGLGKN